MDEIKQVASFFQGLYALIIGLSLTEAIRSVVQKENLGHAKSSVLKFDHFPSLVGFFCIVLPFYQGMGRHFFDEYLHFNYKKADYSTALMIDGLSFLIEASVMFCMSTLLAKDIWRLFFKVIIVLMALDSLWAVTIWQFTESEHFKYWNFLGMNALLGSLIAIPLLVIRKQDEKTDTYAIFYGMFVNLLVLIVNYIINWNWYFPAIK